MLADLFQCWAEDFDEVGFTEMTVKILYLSNFLQNAAVMGVLFIELFFMIEEDES